MKTEKIKVLIVDDSALMRLILEDMLSSEEDIEIVGKARNGLDAIEKVKKLAPHVVTLDIEMPVMDGITALRGILEANPTVKVIMFSTLTKRGADATIKCLELGAFDFVHKPSQSDKDEIQSVKTDLITKIRSAFMSLCSDKTLKLDQTYPKKVSKVPDEKGDYNLLLVASSTGGPQALMKLLPQLPKNFPAPIAIVQHMPPGFTKSFSSRLDQLCNIHVVEGSENTPMTPGVAILAPGGQHMIIKETQGRMHCHLANLPPVNGVKPAADVLFQSVSLLENAKPVTVILTGMGKVGAKGALLLKEEKNSFVIAESPETAVIFGMPKAAGEVGAVDIFLPLDQIAPKITSLFQ